MKMIKYQCSYCNTLYEEGSCPSCGALRGDATKINYTPNIEKRKKMLSEGSNSELVYRVIYMIHFFVGFSFAGIIMAVPTSIVHIISIFAMRKKPKDNVYNGFKVQSPRRRITFLSVVRILDMIMCVISVVLLTLAVIYADEF